MRGSEFQQARLRAGLTQVQAADKLQVSQAYLSMVEKGHRAVSKALAARVAEVWEVPAATPLPMPAEAPSNTNMRDFKAELGALGYPGFKYHKAHSCPNPAEMLFAALNTSNLDARVTEGLPWVSFAYTDMDWDWLVRRAKLENRQNRLGFVVELSSELAGQHGYAEKSQRLRERLNVLERSRLACEDTLCHDALTAAERRWLRDHRAPNAQHWNLLTDLTVEQLVHV